MRFNTALLLSVLLFSAAGTVVQAGSVKTTLAGGLTVSDGNSEALQANVSLLSELELSEVWALRLGVEANYGESTVDAATEKTVENAKLFAHAKRSFTEELFAYIDSSVYRDEFADVDYRAILGPGLGYSIYKTGKAELTIELGASYVFQELAETADDFLTIRAKERFEYKISDTAKLWQEAEYLPEVDDVDNYLVNAEIGVEAALSTKLNLRVVVQDKYVSTPSPGLKENDVSLIAGVSVNL